MSVPNLMVARLSKFELSNIMYMACDQGTAEITLNPSSPHSARQDDSDDSSSSPALSALSWPCLLPNIANCLKLHAVSIIGDSRATSYVGCYSP